MIEKYRLYEKQYLQNIVTTDFTWHRLDFGSMGCRSSGNFDPTGNGGWLEVLPWRKSIYLKNQGENNDNATNCQIEIYFDNYNIQKFTGWWVPQGTVIPVAGKPYAMSYNATTGLFTVDTNGDFVFDVAHHPLENHAYIELPPFGPQDSNWSDHSYLNAVLRNITNVGGNVYTFDVVTAPAVLPYRGDEQVKEMLIKNSLLSYKNNASFHGPTIYQWDTVGPTIERGIILDVGETYSADLTYDICIWYKAVASTDIGATLVLQQLA